MITSCAIAYRVDYHLFSSVYPASMARSMSSIANLYSPSLSKAKDLLAKAKLKLLLSPLSVKGATNAAAENLDMAAL